MKNIVYGKFIATLVIAVVCTGIVSAEPGVLYERWSIGGSAASMLTESSPADYTAILSTAQWGVGTDPDVDNYRSRLTGYLKIPATGTYYFWINTDDNGVLWLSKDGASDKAVQICQETVWSDPDTWAAIGDEEVSQGIALQAGQVCWIRGGQQEGGGGDHIQIAWQCAEAGIAAPTVLGAPYIFTTHPNAPTNPNPTDGAVDVPLDKILSWSPPLDPNGVPVDYVTGHHVYFGTDPAHLADYGVQAAGDTDFDPAAVGAALVIDKKYYWRIDENIQDFNSVTGPVWSFKSVRTIPDILTQPVDVTSITGMDAIFAMDVYNPLTGNATGLTFAWKKVGSETVVSTEATLVITGVTLADEGEYYCTVTNSNGSRDSSPAVLDVLNDVVHWKFNESSGMTAADSSGNGIDGTVGAGAVWVPGGGKEGDGAIHLPGVSTATVIATNVDLTTKPVSNIFKATSPWTINIWVNFQASSGISMIGGFGDCDWVEGGELSDRYYNTWDGTVEFNFGDDGFWYTAYTTKTWQMWTLTFDATTQMLTYYRDGVKVESKWGALADVTENAFKLGDVGAVAWAGSTVPINAIFDDFRVYDGCVTAKDIQFLFTNEFTCNQAPAMDFDGDCVVGVSDLAILVEQWMKNNRVE